MTSDALREFGRFDQAFRDRAEALIRRLLPFRIPYRVLADSCNLSYAGLRQYIERLGGKDAFGSIPTEQRWHAVLRRLADLTFEIPENGQLVCVSPDPLDTLERQALAQLIDEPAIIRELETVVRFSRELMRHGAIHPEWLPYRLFIEDVFGNKDLDDALVIWAQFLFRETSRIAADSLRSFSELLSYLDRYVAAMVRECTGITVSPVIHDLIDAFLSVVHKKRPGDVELLRKYYGLDGHRAQTYAEIASEIGVTPVRVRHRVIRVLQEVQKKLRKQDVTIRGIDLFRSGNYSLRERLALESARIFQHEITPVTLIETVR